MNRIIAAVVVFGAGIFLTGAAWAQHAEVIEKGEKVFMAQKCQLCHSVAGKGNKNGALDGVGSKLTPEQIRQWIVDAPTMTAKTKAARKPAMKAYTNIPKDDLDALVAYLASVKK